MINNDPLPCLSSEPTGISRDSHKSVFVVGKVEMGRMAQVYGCKRLPLPPNVRLTHLVTDNGGKLLTLLSSTVHAFTDKLNARLQHTDSLFTTRGEEHKSFN